MLGAVVSNPIVNFTVSVAIVVSIVTITLEVILPDNAPSLSNLHLFNRILTTRICGRAGLSSPFEPIVTPVSARILARCAGGVAHFAGFAIDPRYTSTPTLDGL
jgi:hypothetical protein